MEEVDPDIVDGAGVEAEEEEEEIDLPILKTFTFVGATLTGAAVEDFLKALNFMAGWGTGAADTGTATMETGGEEAGSAAASGVGEFDDEGEESEGPASASGLGLVLAFLIPKASLRGAAPSSRCSRPTAGASAASSSFELEAEGSSPAWALARSICSRMSIRSRCSSEVVARSFFWDAS